MRLLQKRLHSVIKLQVTVIVTLFLLLNSVNVYAFKVWPRPFANAETSYSISSAFSNYGGTTWVNAANGAAYYWNNSTAPFILYFDPSTNNEVTLGYDSKPTLLGWTDIYGGNSNQIYRTAYDININVANGQGYWDGVNPPTMPTNWYDLRSLIMHEMGHAIGLDHTNDDALLMDDGFSVNTIYSISQDEINAVNYLYNLNYSGPLPESTGYEPNRYATAGTYDDRNGLVGYAGGPWIHDTGWPKAYNSSDSYINNRKRTWLAFQGGRITYSYTMANNRGSAKVYIDGLYNDTINASSNDTRWQVAKTWQFVSGQHTIEVFWDVSNPSSKYIDIDAFTVDIPAQTAGNYENDISQVKKIGNWTPYNGAGPSGNSVHYSKNVGDAISFTFSGSTIKWYYTKAFNRGKANVTIDGVHYAEVDLYSASIQWQQQQTYNLSNGVHTIHISVTGRTSGSDTYVDVDKFIVQ